MAEPNWSSSYSLSATPEANGFTRWPYPLPATVTLTTTGPTAGRKVTVSATDASAGMSFLLTSVPNLDAAIGATAEVIVSVSGAGDAGFEVKFLSTVVGICIFANRIELTVPGTDGEASVTILIATASNAAATTIRGTVDAAGTFRLYRNAVLIDGPRPLLPCQFTMPSFQWWAEGQGTFTFTKMAVYLGGAVVA